MEKIHQFDGLRGWMSLWVWFAHGLTLASLDLHKTEGLGRVLANAGGAVGVFILLSGFVCALMLTRADTTGYRGWLTRRFFRLFPVYLIALALSVMALDLSIAALVDNPWPSPRTEDRLGYLLASRENFWPHLLLHASLLHGVVPESMLRYTSLAFMGQAWSLSLEWQFYLVVPFLIGWITKPRSVVIVPALTVAALLLLSRLTPQDSFLGSHLFMFAIGAYTFTRMKAWKAGQLSTGQWLVCMAIETALVIGIAGGTKGLAMGIWAVTVFSALNLGGNLPVWRAVNGLLNHPVSQFLGRVSYSVYCLHMLVLLSLSWLLIHVVGFEARWQYATALIVTALPATLLVAWFFASRIEEPMIALGRRLAKGPRTTPPVVAATR